MSPEKEKWILIAKLCRMRPGLAWIQRCEFESQLQHLSTMRAWEICIHFSSEKLKIKGSNAKDVLTIK